MSIRAIMNLVESQNPHDDGIPVNPVIPAHLLSSAVDASVEKPKETREQKLQRFADSIIENLGKDKAIRVAQMIMAQTGQGTIEEQITGQLHLLTEGSGGLGGIAWWVIKSFGKMAALEIGRRIMDRATKV